MSTDKSQLRIAEFRSRADAATSAAAASPLARQREQHEKSAAVWIQMAEAEERRVRERAYFAPPPAEATAADEG